MCTRDPKHVALCPKPVCVSGGPRWNRSVARKPESLSVAHVTHGAQCPRSRCVPATFHSASGRHFAFRTCFCAFLSRTLILTLLHSTKVWSSLSQVSSPRGGQDAAAGDEGPLVHTVASRSGALCSLAVRYPSILLSVSHRFPSSSQHLCTRSCVYMRTRLLNSSQYWRYVRQGYGRMREENLPSPRVPLFSVTAHSLSTRTDFVGSLVIIGLVKCFHRRTSEPIDRR